MIKPKLEEALVIKTEDPKLWFEVTADPYNWIVETCENKITRNPKTQEEKPSIVKNKTCFGSVHICFQHIWSEAAKRKLDCKDLREFVKELREMHKNLANQINRLLGDKGYSEEPVTHDKWDKVMNDGE